MIDIRNMTKRYGARTALADVSIAVRCGEIVVLLGANGAGKSTLLRCVLGVISFEGQIRVGGRDPLADGAAVRSLIGYMPQSGGLHQDLTVMETLRFYSAIRRIEPDRLVSLAGEAGLADHLHSRVGDLSGGLRQRLGFALALLADPDVLILDEPTASLDAEGQRWLAERLRALAEEGRTVLVSTHASQALLDAADRTITLADGAVNEQTTHTTIRPAQVPVHQPRSITTTARAASSAAPIAIKELRDAARSRWLIAYAITLGVLGLAATATAIDSVSGLTIDAFGRTTATLMNLCLLFSPLIAIVTGAHAIAGEQERGTLDNLLAQPVSRSRLLLAKYAGLLLALVSATVAGFLPAAVVIAAATGGAMIGPYLLFPGLAICAVASMSGIGVLVSVVCRSAAQAQGAAVVLWFAFTLLYDLLLVGALSTSGIPVQWLAAALVANPIDATRVLGVLALEPDLYLLGPAGAFLTAHFSAAGTAALLGTALVFWTLAPIAGAVATFAIPSRRKGHDPNNLSAARGLCRPGADDRMPVGRGVTGA